MFVLCFYELSLFLGIIVFFFWFFYKCVQDFFPPSAAPFHGFFLALSLPFYIGFLFRSIFICGVGLFPATFDHPSA